jgi:hypothetical protein
VSAPPARYAANGDIHLAYRTVGDGPLDLVFVAGPMTNLDVLWDLHEYRAWVEELASFSLVILFGADPGLDPHRRRGEGGDDRRLALGRVDA